LRISISASAIKFCYHFLFFLVDKKMKNYNFPF
jgi:hypothetical protein